MLKVWPRCALFACILAAATIYLISVRARLPSLITSGFISQEDDTSEDMAVDIFSEDGDISLADLPTDPNRLYYNRVPKCGSTTLYNLMRKLSTLNGFSHYNSKLYDQKRISEEQQLLLVQNVTSTPAPCSFDRHVFFVNFTRFGSRPPVFINLIRDPVERIISSFFYRRVAAKHNPNNKASKFWMTKQFATCVTTHDPECSFMDGEKYGVLFLPYFCGQDDRCMRLNDPWALQRAKRTVAESYAVVGVLEELNVTLRVLEAVVPKFFRGVVKLFHSAEHHWNRNKEKEQVSEDVKALVKANLTAEYELYYFVLQRLHQQFRKTVKLDTE